MLQDWMKAMVTIGNGGYRKVVNLYDRHQQRHETAFRRHR